MSLRLPVAALVQKYCKGGWGGIVVTAARPAGILNRGEGRCTLPFGRETKRKSGRLPRGNIVMFARIPWRIHQCEVDCGYWFLQSRRARTRCLRKRPTARGEISGDAEHR